jgi:serine/threonine-protein kinase
MQPADPALPGFQGWETVEKLGEGGMCEVYRVRPADGEGSERALKVLMDRSDTAIRRFVDEAALLQRIDHPNVVKVHAIDATARPPWLVMDLLGGRDLEETIRVEGAMDTERAARVFADLANALAAVHAAGVRHRDIKPANIRFGTDGVPRLIDFGIARDAGAERRTRQGFVVGTASYLPPEIFVEDDTQAIQDTETADVYALGQTLCEVLAGQVTHGHRSTEGTEASLLVRIMRDKIDREFLDPRDRGARVPDELAQIVRRATTREPEDRTASAGQLEAALRAFLAGRESIAELAPVTRVDPSLLAPAARIPEPPPPAAPPPPAPESPRRGSGIVAMGAVGAAGMMGTGAILAGAVLVVLVGIGTLWVFRPPDSGAEAAVQAAVAALEPELAACSNGDGRLSVGLTVREGRAELVELHRSTVAPRTERCVTKVLTRASYPVVAPVEIELPLVFR